MDVQIDMHGSPRVGLHAYSDPAFQGIILCLDIKGTGVTFHLPSLEVARQLAESILEQSRALAPADHSEVEYYHIPAPEAANGQHP